MSALPHSSLACPCQPQATGTKKASKPLAYAQCCGRFIDHWESAAAPDAERLMRSRYTAFVLEKADYLRNTWHSSTRPATVEFEAATQWLGLEIKNHQITSDNASEVEFVARYRTQGRATRLHERSRFVQENGRWFYVDGDFCDG